MESSLVETLGRLFPGSRGLAGVADNLGADDAGPYAPAADAAGSDSVGPAGALANARLAAGTLASARLVVHGELRRVPTQSGFPEAPGGG